MDRFPQRTPPEITPPSIWTYVASLGLWLSLCIGAAAAVVVANVRDVEKALSQTGDAYSDQLNKDMVSSETILKGFSALFAAVGRTDPEQASRYVRQVIESNPQIFALEIVQTVAQGELAEFVEERRQRGHPDFSVKSFSYDADRKWQALQEKPFYYPIVFMEPMPADSEEVLGLDVDSVPFLRQAMTASIRRGAPVASHPFRLVEGNLAYVVFRPIPRTVRAAVADRDALMVAMVIDAVRLTQPARSSAFEGATVRIHHRDFRPDDPTGQLLAESGRAHSPLEEALFPAFVYEKPLATMGEPFALTVRRQVGWSDLSLGLLALVAVLTLVSSALLVAYLRAHQRGRVLQIEHQNRLWELANHDVLTGLPNRMLLLDRMTQLLARARRGKGRVAVMFLDLDDFKDVNDSYGHETGDRLLRFVAERLRAAVRTDDTVARISGDEFIVLVEGVQSPQALEALRQKIQQKLAEDFVVEGRAIRVQASTGVATFPDDGDTPDALIRQADLRMYANKKARTPRLHLA